MYLSYAEYQAMGGTKDETTFTNMEFEARAIIDWYTFGRLKKETQQCEEVKRCMYYLITRLSELADAKDAALRLGADAGSKSVASQSNDGVSISYNTISYAELAKDLLESEGLAVKRFLQGVVNELGHRVLYRGIYPDE